MKSLDLQQINVVELKVDEQIRIDGGIAPLVLYGLCYLAGVAVGAAIVYFGNQE